MIRRALSAALLMLGGPLAAQAAPAGADTVKLTFAWPTGAPASVIARRYRERLSDGTGDTTLSQVRYRMELRGHPDGFEVFTGDLKIDGLENADSAVSAKLARVTSLVPAYVVTRDGEFRSLSDPARFRAMIDSLLAPVRAELHAANPGADSLLAAMTSDAMLAASVAQEWNAMVGFWTGGELEVGSAYEFEHTEPIPVLGVDLPMRYEFGILGRAACDSAAGGKGCVELQMIGEPEQKAVAALIADVMASAAPAAHSVEVGSKLTIRTIVKVLAEPATLRPYYLAVSKEVDMAFTVDGVLSTVRQVDVREQWYAYGK